MQKELFEDLMKLNEAEGGDRLEAVIRKHATKAQTKILNNSGGIVAGIDLRGNTGKDSTMKTVRLTGYGHKAGAEQDVAQFRHPNVFAYRTALFPNPQSHGVTVLVTDVKSVELKDKEVANPMYKWAIDLTLVVSGPVAKRDGWLKSFENKIRVTNK